MENQKRPCFYLVASDTEVDVDQEIYGAFLNPSLTFLECVIADFQSNTEMIGQKCMTYGFIFEMIKHGYTENAEIIPRYAKDIKNLLKEKNTKFPVIVLDEFSTEIDDSDGKQQNQSTRNEMYRFMRNIFRYLRFPLIIMGTNTSAIQLYHSSKKSRGQGSFWCLVFSNLPSTAWESLEIPELNGPASVLLTYIIQHSRPLFAHTAASFIKSNASKEINNEFIETMLANGVNFTLIGHVTKGKLQIDGEHFGFIKEVKNLYNEALGKHLDN
jgi:hypothetical protein